MTRIAPFIPTVLMERISRILEVAPAPLSKHAIRVETKGKDEVLLVALELLVAKGYVVAEDGPRRAVLHRSVRAFRKDDET